MNKEEIKNKMHDLKQLLRIRDRSSVCPVDFECLTSECELTCEICKKFQDYVDKELNLKIRGSRWIWNTEKKTERSPNWFDDPELVRKVNDKKLELYNERHKEDINKLIDKIKDLGTFEFLELVKLTGVPKRIAYYLLFKRKIINIVKINKKMYRYEQEKDN